MSVCGRLEKQLTGSLDWNDTFLNIDHLTSSFPAYTVRVKTNNPTAEPRPPFRCITAVNALSVKVTLTILQYYYYC